MNNQRVAGIEKEITRILGKVMQEELKNSKIKGMPSVVRTVMTKDGKFADVYISVLQIGENKQSNEQMMESLNSIRGFLKKRLSQELKLRFIPDLRINLDDSIEYGVRISKLLNELK